MFFLKKIVGYAFILTFLCLILFSYVSTALSSDEISYWHLSDNEIDVKIYKDNLHVEVQRGSGSLWIMDGDQSHDINFNGNNDAFSSQRTFSSYGDKGLIVEIDQGSGSSIKIKYIIESNHDLVIELDASDDPNSVLIESRYPRAFFASEDTYVYTHNQGGLVSSSRLRDEENIFYQTSWSGVVNIYSMPWWGAIKSTQGTYKGEGYIAIVETPYDAGMRVLQSKGISPLWISSLGSLRYTRIIRYSFYEKDADYVILAKRYRQYKIDKGDFKTLDEKAQENSWVDGLKGSLLGRPWMCYEGNRWPVERVCESDENGDALPTQQCVTNTFSEILEYVQRFKNKMDENINAVVTMKGPGWHGYNSYVPYQNYEPCSMTGPRGVNGPVRYAGGADAWRILAEDVINQGYLIGPMDNFVMFHHATELFKGECENGYNEECPCTWNSERTSCNPDTDNYGKKCSGWQGGSSSCLCGARAKDYAKEVYDHLIDDYGIKINFAYVDQITAGYLNECYFLNDPVSRKEAADGFNSMFKYLHEKGIVTQSESGADWAFYDMDAVWSIPKCTDFGCKSVPLLGLVYHDSMIIYNEFNIDDKESNMYGLLWGLTGNDRAAWAYPQINGEYERYAIDLAKVHNKIGFDEMVSHEFIGNGWERTRFEPSSVVIEANPSTGECRVKGISDLYICSTTPAEECSVQGGYDCSTEKKCSGSWVVASDTDYCCSEICVEKCDDGTEYAACSDDKPYFCDEGELIEACGSPYDCGCPEGTECMDDGTCKNPLEMEFIINKGWNLFYNPFNESLDTQIIESECGSFSAYSITGGQIETSYILDAGKAYMLRVEENCILNINGTEHNSTSFDILSGWNVAGADRDISISSLLSLCGDNLILYAFDKGRIISVKKEESLEKRKAYFIRSGNDCSLSF